jgi:N-acetylmuramoyl-L-alanine amidase CwlA
MNIIECVNTANTTESKNRKIKYIVIHYTAGITSKPGTAKSTAKYFAKETAKASADFIIDDENIVQYNPDIKNRYCWHCGGSKYKTKGGSLYKVCTSANSIGIEMCSTNSTKKVTSPNDANWYFTDAVIDNCVELTKKLMEEYNIKPDHVIRHYDINGKLCPGIIGWNEDTNDISKWQDFIIRVSPIPEEIVIEEPKEEIIEVKVPEVKEEPKPEVKEEKPEKIQEKPIEKGFFEVLLDILLKLFKK